MISEKPWKPEAVIQLCALLFASIFAGWLLCAGVALSSTHGWIPAANRIFAGFLISALTFQGAILIGLYFFLRKFRLRWGEAFGFSKPNLIAAIYWGLLAGLFVLPFVFVLGNFSVTLLKWFHISAPQQVSVKMLQVAMPGGQTFVYGVFAVLLAPIAEELIFRGVLYPTFKQTGHPRLALWGAALLFAATHLNLMSFLPLTFLAVVLTLLYEQTENLIAPIVTHATFNAVNFYLIVAPADWKPDWFPA